MLGAFRRAVDNARGTTHVQEATRHRHHHPETAQVYWPRRRPRRQSHGPRVERRCTEDQGQVRHCFPQDTGTALIHSLGRVIDWVKSVQGCHIS